MPPSGCQINSVSVGSHDLNEVDLIAPAAQEWPSYGGDPGGQRFSGAAQITPQNVGRLAPAWIFHTGERRTAGPHGSSFEDTPILADGRLLVCTPTDRVFALDPLTGREIWAFDPKLARGLEPAADFLCRGVAVWRRRPFAFKRSAHSPPRPYRARNSHCAAQIGRKPDGHHVMSPRNSDTGLTPVTSSRSRARVQAT